MDKFLERCSLQRMNQEEIENINRPITSPEIEPVILKTPNKQTLGQGDFPGKFYQVYKEELVLILFKLFQKTEEQETLQKAFHEDTITLIPQPKSRPKKKIIGQYHWWI